MIELKQGMIVYHGSYTQVSEPDLSKCEGYKDFGRGFYLTTSKLQAANFAKTSTMRAIANKKVSGNQDFGVVSSFVVEDMSLLRQFVYEQANRDWLHCIVGHRKKDSFNHVVEELKQYDVIFGKIANDSTNNTITAYMAGTFGDIGSARADQICIELLLPNRLENQFCFRTDVALKCLQFAGSEKVWMRK